jgi:hypothetical protein
VPTITMLPSKRYTPYQYCKGLAIQL